jgi:hypothetical protein
MTEPPTRLGMSALSVWVAQISFSNRAASSDCCDEFKRAKRTPNAFEMNATARAMILRPSGVKISWCRRRSALSISRRLGMERKLLSNLDESDEDRSVRAHLAFPFNISISGAMH